MTDIQLVVPAVLVVPPAVLVAAGVVVARALHHGRDLRSTAFAIAMAVYLGAVAAVTVFPLRVVIGEYAAQDAWGNVGFVPVLTIDVPTFVLNIVLFLPFGALLPLVSRWQTARQVVLAGLLLSLGIEVVQYLCLVLLGSGRTADVNDLIANTVGTALGYAALVLARRTALAPLLATSGLVPVPGPRDS